MCDTHVSNLAITDHLPAEIVRCLWLIQSLNMQYEENQQILSTAIKEHEKLRESHYLKASKEIRTRRNVDKHLMVAQRVNSSANYHQQAHILSKKINSLQKECEKLLIESVCEAEKLDKLLVVARNDLNMSNYQLIHAFFADNANKTRLNLFRDAFINPTKPTRISYVRSSEVAPFVSKTFSKAPNNSSLNSLNKCLKNSPSLQYPNDESMLAHFPDYNSQFQDLILSLMSQKTDKRKIEQRQKYIRRQRVLSVLSKNHAFDSIYNNSMKLVFKNPLVKLPRLTINTNANSFFSESDLVTPKSAVARKTPKLKLTMRPSEIGETSLKESIIVDEKSNNGKPVSQKPVSQKPVAKANAATKLSEQFLTDAEEVYCVCRTGSTGKMIGCDDKNCIYGGWFHYKCVGLLPSFEPAANENWYCPWCIGKHVKKDELKKEKKKLERVPYRPPLRTSAPVVEHIDDIDKMLRKKKKTEEGKVERKMDNVERKKIEEEKIQMKPEKKPENKVEKKAEKPSTTKNRLLKSLESPSLGNVQFPSHRQLRNNQPASLQKSPKTNIKLQASKRQPLKGFEQNKMVSRRLRSRN